MKSSCLFFIVLALVAVLAGAFGPTAYAADDNLKDLAAKLATASFDEKAQIVDTLAASADPRVAKLLTAFADGKLFARETDGLVAVGTGEEGSEIFTVWPSGDELASADSAGLERIRVNNMLRRKLRDAAGRLALSAEDTDTRLKAAQTMAANPDEGALPLIDQALEKETVASVRAVLAHAKAAIVLGAADVGDDERIAAIELVMAAGDANALMILRAAANSDSARVKAAAEAAVKSLESNLVYWNFLQNAWYGVSLGSVLLLAAIGLAITMGVMGVINMAHGEMVMLGAYTTYVMQNVVQVYAPSLTNVALLFAVPAAFLVSGAVGIAIERSIIRFLYGRPLETLLATWGLSLVLQQTVRSIFGPTNKAVSSPPWMSGAFELGNLTITYNRLWIIVFSGVVLGLLMLLLKYTRFGLQARAITQNRPMAAAMGIRTNRVDALTFGLGSGIAGMAGVALSQLDNVSPNLGQSYIIDSFMVVVFGGVGSLWGTLVGSMTLGVVNKFLEPYAGAVLGKIFVLVLIILFIQKRPRGLFALRGRALEG